MSDAPQVVVPDGHKVKVFHALREPCVVRTEGGVVIAHLGVGSDDSNSEMDLLVRDVSRTLAAPTREVHLAQCRTLTDLFAPSDPPVVSHAGVVLWAFHVGSVDAWAGRFTQLVERVGAALGPNDRDVVQRAFFMEGPATKAHSLALMLGGARIEPCNPQTDGAMLVEVHRPEGTVLSALLGTPWLTGSTPPQTSTPTPLHVRRAPRLARLLLAIDRGGDLAWRALMQELLQRETHFLLIANPSGAVAPQRWPNVGPALPAYPDELSFGWAVEDVKPRHPVAMAAMPPRALFRWAAENGSAVALNAYRNRATPTYVMLLAHQVAELARGELPQRA